MEQSFYLDQVKQFFPGVAAGVIEKLNDSQNPNNRNYLHRRMLAKEYTPDLKWQSLSTLNGYAVAADVVAMDSSLPLKSRGSIARASGDISKMGMEMALREKQLTDLDIIARTRGPQSLELLQRLFADTATCITGIYENLEYMFLLGLSTGITIKQDPQNVGTGVRIDYGYLAENKFGTDGDTWVGNPGTATPFSDLRKIQKFAATKNKRINKWMMDQSTFDAMIATTEVKESVAVNIGFFGGAMPSPTPDQVRAAARARFGFDFEIVDRSITFERDGVRSSVTPWQAGAVVGLQSDNVGSLTWGTLAEMQHPVSNVNYQTVDDFILVSKYRLNRPSLAEFTSSQALVVPVINDVDSIFLLDTVTPQA